MTTKVSSVMQEDGADAVGLVPVGALVPCLLAAAPANWLLCHGQAVSRTTYAALFAAIGVVAGAGNGTTTFNLPDLRGRVPLGRDNMGGTPANRVTVAVTGLDATALGAAGGSQLLHAHTHGVTDPGHTHGFTGDAVNGVGADTSGMDVGIGVGGPGGTIASATTELTVNSAGTGGAQNLQPSLVVNWIIRAL
jgi:microcystin-dependent protein